MKTIYYNGQVYTGVLPIVSAFSVENGKFCCVGSDEEVIKNSNNNDIKIDLNGNFVCAGFNDSHMHLLDLGRALTTARLEEHTNSLEGMISYFKEFVESNDNKQTEVLVGRGWNQDYYCDEHRLPNRWDLDRVSTDKPVVAIRTCGHCLIVNSKFLETFNIDEDIVCPDGGVIGIENGKLNGLFFDNAMNIVYDHIPMPNKNEIKHMLKQGAKYLNSFGVTSCQTDDLITFVKVDPELVIEAYKELVLENELTVRVYEQSNFNSVDKFKNFLSKGHRTGEGDNMFKIGPLKLLGDGALGPRTALLSIPYKDNPNTKGLACFDQDTLDEMISLANKNDMQIAVHAIGDGALDMLLSSYEKAFKQHPRNDHRCGVVHCQITRPEQLDKIAELGLCVYMQGIFIDYDTTIIKDRVGDKLASSSYRWKTLMKKNVSVSNGTDAPVEMPNALKCIQCSITRSSIKDGSVPYLPEEGFSVEEAINSYTSSSAYASFEENIKGKIQSNMLADYTILEKNPFNVNPSSIKDIKVIGTYLAGEKVY